MKTTIDQLESAAVSCDNMAAHYDDAAEQSRRHVTESAEKADVFRARAVEHRAAVQILRNASAPKGPVDSAFEKLFPREHPTT